MMRRFTAHWKRVLPMLLALGGLAALGASVGADLVGLSGKEGFGAKQLALAVVGLALLAAGVVIGTPFGQRHLLRRPVLSVAYDCPPGVLALAAWFGLMIGLVELAVVAVQQSIFDVLLYRSFRYPWMLPLATLGVFLLVGIGLLAVGRFVPRLVTPRVSVVVLAVLAFADLLFLVPELDLYARFVLAAGLATVMGRLVAVHTRGFYAVVRHTLGWSAALERLRGRQISEQSEHLPGRRQFLTSTGAVLAGLALSTEGRVWVSEQLTAATQPRPAAGLPNVLLIVLDTVRAQSLSLYGYARETSPNLRRLAQTGVRFDHAMATAPWTLPSHASIFTGRYPHELGFEWTHPLRDDSLTLAEVLTAQGYATGGFVANTVFCTREFGLHQGFMHYEASSIDLAQVLTATEVGHELLWDSDVQALVLGGNWPGRKDGNDVTRRFLDWQAQQGERPFFAFLNYFDAHEPYLPPDEFATRFASARPRGVFESRTADQLTPEAIRELNDAYDGAIAYVDHQVALLLAELERRDVLDQTLVVLTSDHGEQFGEHGLMGHLNSLYLPLLHVPLVLSLPRVLPAGARVAAPVSLRDLPATILDLLGLQSRIRFPGATLARHWASNRSGRGATAEPILAEVQQAWNHPASAPAVQGPMKSVRQGSWHYIKNLGTGEEELFDVGSDPGELRNLAAVDHMRPRLAHMRESMQALVSNGLS